MKTLWQAILGGKRESSNIIKEEIFNLTNNGKELENGLVELEASLQGFQTELLADKDGAFEAVRTTEASISENRNKIAGTARVLVDLQAKLEEALEAETINRQKEIAKTLASIDKQIAAARIEIVEHFSKACVLYRDITGQDPSRFGFDFILNHNLSDDLWKLVAENSSNDQEASLYQKRQNLSVEAARIGKGLS